MARRKTLKTASADARPADPDLAHAKALAQRGALREAEALTRKVMAANPFSADAVALLGVIASMAGDPRAALGHLDNAISMDGQIAEFHNSRGIVLKVLGRRDEAREAYETARGLDPHSSLALYNLAILCREDGHHREAVELNRAAVGLEPRDARAHNNLGTSLQDIGDYEQAADAFRQALKLNPDYPAALANLAASLAEADAPEEALKVCRRGKKKWPRHAEILNAECNAYTRLNRLDDALKAANDVLAIDPTHGQAHYAKGMILLMQEHYAEGWREYEWRVNRSGFWPRRRQTAPAWTGGPLAGKTLLVQWEQGFGDIIQFARYLPLLKAEINREARHKGARLLFDCPAKLQGLFEDVLPVDGIGDYRDQMPEHDAHVLLMSLPGILGTDVGNIPSPLELSPTPAKQIDAGGSLKVGLTWASDHGASYRRKVCDVETLAKLFDVPGCTFYGLQFGAEGDALRPHEERANVVNLGNDLGDFAQTAAIVAEMDLIITIDTYIAHLAGCVGTPAWVMLPYSPDWRWQLDRTESPWYPTLRLFRQEAPGDWESVIDKVNAALVEKTAR